ncbi:16S rRNA (cytosine(1402)-N(4))-methyltransferase RsmH [Campylobacter sp.]|uniref:16S rRNA (cytosine(1402)-N(4))-methyltransferase RsmH n=1 Tax=Campylobacter sp. TaxID=205 RepID=UPI0026DB0545|nr:16S rRNA (cytosine(1402)-N(4))-methyltransferase RsmH [Campylobacter sp.]MDO4674518.1 16S rRNA (cytosine(1402)-N(4))-methyltransferase RsmH [Campylobacter sp.]
MQAPHTPVLLQEILQLFSPLKEGVFLDGTLGYAGHSQCLLDAHPKLRLIACDQDDEALKFSQNRLEKFSQRVSLHHCNFTEIFDRVESSSVRGILADIGLSSLQMDANRRGFSMRSDFLDMRMDRRLKFSAFDVVNSYSKDALALIFREYGELKDAEILAQKIIKARAQNAITSGKKLREIIGDARLDSRKISKATLVFQAIRIEVNKELENLRIFLEKVENLGLKDCILAVICFHSLEDRMVKHFFKKWSRACICDERVLRCECGGDHHRGQILSKKPIVPSDEEVRANPRSSCAKMRAFYFRQDNARR